MNLEDLATMVFDPETIKDELWKLKEKSATKIKLTDLCADLVGQKVTFKAQVVGEALGKAIPRYLHYKCKHCGKELCTIDLLNEENFQEIYTYITQNKLPKVLNPGPCPAGRGGAHIPTAEPSKEKIDLAILYVRETPENLQVASKEEYINLATKVWRIWLIGCIPRAWRTIRVIGYVVANERSKDIEIIGYCVTGVEDDFQRVSLTPEEHKKFAEIFQKQFNDIVKHQIAPEIISRDFAKLASLLVLHSPLELKNPFTGKIMRGHLRVVFFGDSKTGKSTIGKDLTYEFYGLGTMVFGEMSSRAGLTYTIDTEKRALIWGILPQNDCGLVFIDGIHTLSKEEIEQLREALEQGLIKVTRSVSGERPARVRIIATLNPASGDMSNYFFKVQGLMHSRIFSNPVDITRWDIFVPFCDDDIDAETLATAMPEDRPINKETFIKHVYWVWSLKSEDIIFDEEAKTKIIEKTKEFLQYRISECPIIHSGFREVLIRLSAAFACLKHSVENGKVIVRSKHVEEAAQFINETLRLLEYDKFADRLKDTIDLSENEFDEIKQSLDDIDLEILEALVTGPKKSTELSAIIGISDRSVKEHYKNLRKFGLLVTSLGFGAKLTPKGIKFLKRLKQDDEESNKQKREDEQKQAENEERVELKSNIKEQQPAKKDNKPKIEPKITAADVPILG